MMRNKIIIGLIILIIILPTANLLYDSFKISSLKEILIREDYRVVDSIDGNSGNQLKSGKIDYLMDLLKESKFKRKLDIVPKGGWSYAVEIESDRKNYKLVFSSNNLVSINGKKYSLDKNFE